MFQSSLQTCVAATFLLYATTSFAAKNDWAEGTPNKEGTGATVRYYNAAGYLSWEHEMGDWHDAQGIAQGNTPYVTTTVSDDDTGKFVDWDVSPLVAEWLAGKHQNQGFFLRPVGEGGTIIFASRESNPKQQPRLILASNEGAVELTPQADTYLDKSTAYSLGNTEMLKVSGVNPAILRFDLAAVSKLGKLSKATLRLFSTHQYGATEIGVFRCQQGQSLPPSEPQWGLAAKYPNDQKISQDANVVFATNFESDKWTEEWTHAGEMAVIDTVSADSARKFEPLQQKALRVRVATGNTSALNTLYKFQKETGSEPEDIYFRYYLRFGNDWNQTIQNGKLPGISGTYDVAGWGGRKVDGTDGWSARGGFLKSMPEDNPLSGLHPIGTYCYHADMEGWFGDIWVWNQGYRGFLEKNRWYSIEQFLKLNSPGKKDGIIRAWVDGQLAFEKTDIRFRDVDRLKIDQVWMNVYHGGTLPSPYDQHLFIDNVVIARKYIGPMKPKQ